MQRYCQARQQAVRCATGANGWSIVVLLEMSRVQLEEPSLLLGRLCIYEMSISIVLLSLQETTKRMFVAMCSVAGGGSVVAHTTFRSRIKHHSLRHRNALQFISC
eukprot:TRINITY_DN3094_c0_g1_i1.p2 TRINITY_DN3094_c0_g1~~TRINITY_DN3094_c0_g1_i1.p2  ORF type:complete len:105 (-),score=10.45 TRINITY_DN3094_c0_g1_i1:42-356(-)